MDANISAYAQAAVFVGAAIAIGIGTVGPAVAQGMIGAKACENVGKYPESYSKIRMTMIIAMGLVETCAIYVLLVAMLVIFKAS
jgi:F-type H+-transporting ATPase subunit c